jgi:hypothetical protein
MIDPTPEDTLSGASERKRIYDGYKERKITDLEELKLLISGLDLDEGIRFVAELPGYEHGAFVFITKSGGKFCANIKERVPDGPSGGYVPGKREEWKYFTKPHEAWNFVSKLLKPPIEAFYY